MEERQCFFEIPTAVLMLSRQDSNMPEITQVSSQER
jgi:hypothetical protein